MNHGPRNSKPVKRPSGQSGAAHKSPVRKGQITHARKPGSKKTRRAFSTPVKVLLGALVTVALTCLIVGITMLVYMIAFTHGDPAINLDEYKANQNQTTIVYAYDKNQQPVEVTRLHGTENRIWVNLSQMPEEMKQSVIAIEDKRFEKHNGVDWFRTASAIVKHGMSQGGSTITQQLIKNLTGDKDVTIVRKFREILYALNLERNYSKDEILEAYLNTIYLGEGCYGVKTAAEKYFGKDVSELNLAECTALLGITQYPYKYDPLVNPENNKARQKYGLDVLLEEGTISQKEYDEAIAYSLVFTNSKEYKAAHKDDKKAAESESKIQSYYVDYVVDQVIDDLMEQYGLTEQQATQKVYYGGLKIYTAMDPDVQSSMENVFYNRKTVANKGVQAAMTVMDYKGRVVGVVGGLGEKQQNRGLNRAVSSKRQPGSSIKPLSIYAPAIENNLYNWSSMIADSPSRYVDGKPWPVNYGQKVGDGQLHPLQYAVERSLNTVPARMLEKITIKTSFDFLENHFHLSTLEKSDADWAPLVTGAFTQGVTTLDMAAAYAAIGNGGTYYEPYCYYKVTNSSGSETLLQTSVKGERYCRPTRRMLFASCCRRTPTTARQRRPRSAASRQWRKPVQRRMKKTVGLPRARPIMCRPPGMAMIRLKPFISIPTITPPPSCLRLFLIRFTKIWRPKNLGKAASRLRRNIVRKPACWPRHPALLRRRDGIRLPIRRQCAPPAAVPVCSIILRTMFPMRLGRRGMSFLMPSIMQVRLWRMH